MPTVLRENGYRFFFYSNEFTEPVHLHVEKGNAEGKIWLKPTIKIEYFNNFSPREQSQVLAIIHKNYLYLMHLIIN